MKFSLQKYAFLLLAMCFWLESSMGQEKTEKFEVGAQYHYGFLWSHRNNLEVLAKGYMKSFELSFYKQFNGSEDWELKYRHPQLGGSFMYFDFGNPEEMGYGYTLFAFYDFPLAGNQNNALIFKIGPRTRLRNKGL